MFACLSCTDHEKIEFPLERKTGVYDNTIAHYVSFGKPLNLAVFHSCPMLFKLLTTAVQQLSRRAKIEVVMFSFRRDCYDNV